MKHIHFKQYRRIHKELTIFLFKHPDPCNYLFQTINNRQFAKPEQHGGPEKLLPMSKIKELWNSSSILSLVTFAIQCHYEGHIVDTTEQSSTLIQRDFLKIEAQKLTKL